MRRSAIDGQRWDAGTNVGQIGGALTAGVPPQSPETSRQRRSGSAWNDLEWSPAALGGRRDGSRHSWGSFSLGLSEDDLVNTQKRTVKEVTSDSLTLSQLQRELCSMYEEARGKHEAELSENRTIVHSNEELRATLLARQRRLEDAERMAQEDELQARDMLEGLAQGVHEEKSQVEMLKGVLSRAKEDAGAARVMRNLEEQSAQESATLQVEITEQGAVLSALRAELCVASEVRRRREKMMEVEADVERERGLGWREEDECETELAMLRRELSTQQERSDRISIRSQTLEDELKSFRQEASFQRPDGAHVLHEQFSELSGQRFHDPVDVSSDGVWDLRAQNAELRQRCAALSETVAQEAQCAREVADLEAELSRATDRSAAAFSHRLQVETRKSAEWHKSDWTITGDGTLDSNLNGIKHKTQSPRTFGRDILLSTPREACYVCTDRRWEAWFPLPNVHEHHTNAPTFGNRHMCICTNLTCVVLLIWTSFSFDSSAKQCLVEFSWCRDKFDLTKCRT